MNSFLILGAGKLATQIIRKIEILNTSLYQNILGFYDDKKSVNTEVYKDLRVMGKFSDVYKFDHKEITLIPAIGYNELQKRLNVLNNFHSHKFNFENLVFSNHIFTEDIGIGNFFSPNTVIDVGSKIGNFNFFDISTSIGEDCEVGDGNYFSNSSVICGHCKISHSSFFGSNATLIDKVRIGSNCKINSSSLIHNDLKSNLHYLEARKHFVNESI